MDVVDWLLQGDPAIRWQAGRDLLNWPVGLVKTQRARIATEGWGKALLDLQDEDGTWGGGLYSPKWTSTTYSLLQLRRFGLPRHPAAARGVEILLDFGYREDGGVDLSKTTGKTEDCVTGMVLSLAATYTPHDDRIAGMMEYLADRQLNDGGWNCIAEDADSHSSVHTTIGVLEGLALVNAPGLAEPAHEFLLQHRLYKSHRTGEAMNPVFTRFSFPPRWHYDVLRALDYLATVDAPQDERLTDAIELLEKKQNEDGTWNLQNTHKGRTFFDLEKAGQPSRWNTLRAMRVLRWWAPAG